MGLGFGVCGGNKYCRAGGGIRAFIVLLKQALNSCRGLKKCPDLRFSELSQKAIRQQQRITSQAGLARSLQPLLHLRDEILAAPLEIVVLIKACRRRGQQDCVARFGL